MNLSYGVFETGPSDNQLPLWNIGERMSFVNETAPINIFIMVQNYSLERVFNFELLFEEPNNFELTNMNREVNYFDAYGNSETSLNDYVDDYYDDQVFITATPYTTGQVEVEINSTKILIITLQIVDTGKSITVFNNNFSITLSSIVIDTESNINSATPMQGDGTLNNPYQVSNFYHLNSARDELAAYYVLANNLTALSPGYIELAGPAANSGQGWEPIGYGANNRFVGSFNGNGYTISDLFINRPLTDNVGLFGHIGISSPSSATTISNVCLLNVSVTGKRGVGALVGRVTGNQLTLIKNAGVIGGYVSGNGATGGLVGSNNSFQETGAADRNPQIQTSFAKVNVIAERPETGLGARAFEKFGGLAGCSQKGTIADSYSLSTVTIKDASATRVGGLVGCNILNGRVARSYSKGYIVLETAALGSTNVGVLIGNSDPSQGGIVALSNNYYANNIFGNAAIYGVGSLAIDPSGVNARTSGNMQGLDALTDANKMNLLNASLWTATNLNPILKDIWTQLQIDAQ